MSVFLLFFFLLLLFLLISFVAVDRGDYDDSSSKDREQDCKDNGSCADILVIVVATAILLIVVIILIIFRACSMEVAAVEPAISIDAVGVVAHTSITK